MELKEFVTSAIEQIIEGVTAAQTHATKKGAAVNPAFNVAGTHSGVMGTTEADVLVLKVHFDVAVTAVESTEAKGGAKVQVAGPISVGGGAGVAERAERVSRLQFIVPLALPDDPSMREQAKQAEAERDAAFRAPVRGNRRGGY